MTILSNQSVALKKGGQKKTYTFSKSEFDKNKVPPYAYDLTENGDTVSFTCAFDSLGDPIFKKKAE
ncbi:hypothetical protein NXH76_18850 [Blautia schinkii]|nr:hypothetical protein [Blautia schinkii]